MAQTYKSPTEQSLIDLYRELLKVATEQSLIDLYRELLNARNELHKQSNPPDAALHPIKTMNGLLWSVPWCGLGILEARLIGFLRPR